MLRRVHRGVYLVGPVKAPLGHVAAALLAAGPSAVASHRTAGWLWALLREPPRPDVTVSARDRRHRAGIRVHRDVGLTAAEVRRRDGLALTAPARTLVDLAVELPDIELAGALEEARFQGLVSRRDLDRILQLRAGRPGSAPLRAAVSRDGEPRLTRSEAERRLVRMVRDAGLPLPETNVRVAGLMVDALWRASRLVVEVDDGYRFHGSRTAFERDRARDARLLAAGFRVLRVTFRQFEDEPLIVVARLAAALN